MFRRFVCAVLCAILILPAMSLTPSAAGEMRSEMSAFDYAREMGIGINLGNTMEGFWSGGSNPNSGSQIIGSGSAADYEKCWGASITTEKMIKAMASEGFNTVRIPVYWGNGMTSTDSFKINKVILDRVEEIVNWCLDANLYAVVNMHHYDEYLIKNFPKDKVLSAVDELWKQIAERFRDYSDRLVFEGFNENVGSHRDQDNYSDSELFEYANELNQTFVDAVRSTGGNNAERLLIVSGYNTNIDKTTDSRFKMPTDTARDRLMISVHYVDNGYYWSKQIGSSEWMEGSKAQCELLKKAFTDKGIPVFMGETTSAYPRENMASGATYGTNSSALVGNILDLLLDYGFVPVYWDTDNSESFFSRSDLRIRRDADRETVSKMNQRYGILPAGSAVNEDKTPGTPPPDEERIDIVTPTEPARNPID